jgi:hypothetical protein
MAGMEKTTLEFTVGPGGWLHVGERSETGAMRQFFCVRLKPHKEGHWAPDGTIFLASGLTPESIRIVPLRRTLLAVAASESLREKLEARFSEDAPDPGTPEFLQAGSGFLVPEPKPPPAKLKRPKGRILSDDFYKAVAEAYRVAVLRGEAPRSAIAQSAGVSNDVAGRWVHQARGKGYLADTEQGKVSA